MTCTCYCLGRWTCTSTGAARCVSMQAVVVECACPSLVLLWALTHIQVFAVQRKLNSRSASVHCNSSSAVQLTRRRTLCQSDLDLFGVRACTDDGAAAGAADDLDLSSIDEHVDEDDETDGDSNSDSDSDSDSDNAEGGSARERSPLRKHFPSMHPHGSLLGVLHAVRCPLS